MELNDVDRQRLAKSGIISAFLWLVLLVLAVFAPLRTAEPKVLPFTSVKITLVSNEAERKTTVEPGVSSSAIQSPASSVSPASPTKAQSPSKAKASTGLGIPNFAPASSTARASREDNSSTLDFSSEETSPIRPASSAHAPVAELSGVAGVIDTSGSSGVTAAAPKASSGGAAASQETSGALASISGTAKAGKTAGPEESSGSGTAASASSAGIAASSSVSGLAFDGASRRLLSPSEPSVTLPERLAHLVDSDRSITIQFTVRADGSVPSALVSFSPSAVLPAEIRDFLRKEFSSWRFEKGAADGQASFRYSIKVK